MDLDCNLMASEVCIFLLCRFASRGSSLEKILSEILKFSKHFQRLPIRYELIQGHCKGHALAVCMYWISRSSQHIPFDPSQWIISDLKSLVILGSLWKSLELVISRSDFIQVISPSTLWYLASMLAQRLYFVLII